MKQHDRWDGKPTAPDRILERYRRDDEFMLCVHDVTDLLHGFVAEGWSINDIQDIYRMSAAQFLAEQTGYQLHRTSCGHLPGHAPAYHRRDRPRCR